MCIRDRLATLRHERKRGALLRNKKSALLISDPTCSFYYTETVHQLRAQVERAHEKDGRQVFLITSCAENEGKSTVAANLALSLAQKHQRVLLLDADLRKPAQSLIFSASPAPGTDLGYLITHRPDREALEKAGRRDLIGYTKHCLIRPVPPRPGETSAGGGHGTGKKGGKAHGGAAGKGPKGSKGHGGMSRAQNTAGRNRAAQGRQGANGGGRRN